MEQESIQVLLIEDNPGDARLVKEMLWEAKGTRLELEHADSLSAGLARLDNGQTDLVLLDLNLADSEGLDTFKRAYARAADVPIIVLTGMGDEELAIEAVRQRAQDYLIKGEVEAGLLVRSIRYAIERKRVQEALRIKDRALESSINPIAMSRLDGTLSYVNRSFLRLWGYDGDERVLGRDATEFWSMGGEAATVTEALGERGNWIGNVHGTREDGSRLDLQLSASLVRDELGRALCRVFSFVDVTELRQLRRRLKTEHSFAGIVGRDSKMLDLFDTIRELAEVDVPVLIQGESGTGKELVAAAIHNEGPRVEKPFVPVNCGALPEGVLESELFGHVKGAFTGATRDRKGRFELADGGTIFLDEIGELSPSMQVKLLRVLQEAAFKRVGGEDTVHVDVRVISATNKDLRAEVAAGNFRDDLFYRLHVVPVYLPPLRQRRIDIPLLARNALKKAMAEQGRGGVSIANETLDVMMDYDWPGNVRELENAVQYALLKCKGDTLEPDHLPPDIPGERQREEGSAKRGPKPKLDAESVLEALEETDGNKAEAARKLGVGRATLYRFLEDNREGELAPGKRQHNWPQRLSPP